MDVGIAEEVNFKVAEKSCCTVRHNIQVDWAEEQASRTDEFQRELQAKTEAMSDLNAEKVR